MKQQEYFVLKSTDGTYLLNDEGVPALMERKSDANFAQNFYANYNTGNFKLYKVMKWHINEFEATP